MANLAEREQVKVNRAKLKASIRRKCFTYFTDNWPGYSVAWRRFQANKKADILIAEMCRA